MDSIKKEALADGMSFPSHPAVADIEKSIVSEHYFTAGDVFASAITLTTEFNSLPEEDRIVSYPDKLDQMTFCVLLFKDGRAVAGESLCASPEKFDAEAERKYARQKAIGKVLELNDCETGLTFGLAIEALKNGSCVTRTGWNGKGMWLFLIQGSNDIAKLHGYGFGEYLGEPTFRDAIFMRTVDNQLVPWTASQTDVLAKDWVIVE